MTSTRAPRNAPVTVPTPPSSAVPPMTAAAMHSSTMSGPPASGSMELMRNDSMIPTNPPSTPARMKLPILMRAMLTPASRDPSRSEEHTSELQSRQYLV